jgi:hypothetical protein
MSGDKVITPDPDCPHCHGCGWIKGSADPNSLTGFTSKRCRCLFHQECKRYLREWDSPNISWDKEFDPAQFNKFLQNDLIFYKQYPLRLFREKIKSYLIHQWFRLEERPEKTHLSLTAWDIVQASCGSQEAIASVTQIRNVDLFILYLDNDPSNAAYSQFLTFIVKERQRLNKRTIIWTRYDPAGEHFINLYGEPFSEWLDSPEANFRRISPPQKGEERRAAS